MGWDHVKKKIFSGRKNIQFCIIRLFLRCPRLLVFFRTFRHRKKREFVKLSKLIPFFVLQLKTTNLFLSNLQGKQILPSLHRTTYLGFVHCLSRIVIYVSRPERNSECRLRLNSSYFFSCFFKWDLEWFWIEIFCHGEGRKRSMVL